MSTLSTVIKSALFSILLLFSGTLLAYNLPIFTNPAKPIIVSEDVNEFFIQLPSQPSTGYSWVVVDNNPELIKIKQHEFKKNIVGMPGAGGAESWKIDVKSKAFKVPQQLHITFAYQRPWNGQVGKTVTFMIITR